MSTDVSSDVLISGSKLLVTVEDVINGVIVVSYDDGTRVFRGALLASPHTGLGFGVDLSRSSLQDDLTRTGVEMNSEHADTAKPEQSALKARYSYALDASTGLLNDRMSPQKNIFCPLRNKGLRHMRLRPTKALCVRCKERVLDGGKLTHVKDEKKEASSSPSTPGTDSDKTDSSTLTEIKTSPLIKISFSSPKGQDTVVKIPPKPKIRTKDSDSKVDKNVNNAQYKELKRAFKKAKHRVREARHNLRNNQTCLTRKKAREKEKSKECKVCVCSVEPLRAAVSSDVKDKQVGRPQKKLSDSELSSSSSLSRTNNKPVKRKLSSSDTALTKQRKSRAGRETNALTLVIQSKTIDSVVLNGVSLKTDDVVWGKIQGFPWWPCRVLQLMEKVKDNGVIISQFANVTWFGSSTFSQVSCSALRPFCEDFDLRYNKKKKGAYKTAVREACICVKTRNSELPPISIDLLSD